MKNNSYDTLSEATKSLRERGFKEEVEILNSEHIKLGNQKLGADDVKIEEFHRFEGMTNPGDMSIVYAVSTASGNHKGLLINSFGAKASADVNDFIKNIPNHG
ncbi:MAG: phosphoribosylpyrophosphate synthetase [Vicingaceae bacterium]